MHGRSCCPMIYGRRSTSQRHMAPAHRGLPSGVGLDSSMDQGSPAGDPWWSATLPYASVSVFLCVARHRLRIWRLCLPLRGPTPPAHMASLSSSAWPDTACAYGVSPAPTMAPLSCRPAFQAMPHDLDLRHTVRAIPATR